MQEALKQIGSLMNDECLQFEEKNIQPADSMASLNDRHDSVINLADVPLVRPSLTISAAVEKLKVKAKQIIAYMRKTAETEIRKQMRNTLGHSQIGLDEIVVPETQIKQHLASSSSKILA